MWGQEPGAEDRGQGRRPWGGVVSSVPPPHLTGRFPQSGCWRTDTPFPLATATEQKEAWTQVLGAETLTVVGRGVGSCSTVGRERQGVFFFLNKLNM